MRTVESEQDKEKESRATRATPAREESMPDWARTAELGTEKGMLSGEWVWVTTRRSIFSTSMMLWMKGAFAICLPFLRKDLPRTFQAPTLKRQGWRLKGGGVTAGGKGSAAPPVSREERPELSVETGVWALLKGGDRRLVVGSTFTLGDERRGGISRDWLPLARAAHPPAREGPAVPPPSPSSTPPVGAPTACAGHEGASLCAVIEC